MRLLGHKLQIHLVTWKSNDGNFIKDESVSYLYPTNSAQNLSRSHHLADKHNCERDCFVAHLPRR
jgi:hypothetical protein